MLNALPRYSVGQISQYIKGLFDQDFVLRHLQVEGEISNLKYHPSGHIYFTLKDDKAALSCVMFASYARGLRLALSNGLKVVASGSISTYEKGGSYQLYVNSVEKSGIGDLYLSFEATKKKLAEMGLFDPRYKKPIPPYALRVGVITAPTGAAVQDIINISHRRNPCVQLVLYPALVQGKDAPASLIRGIETLDKCGLDVIILGRGGGSLEDLWAFNEEAVARAVFDAETPIISAVGHETDFTITDFAADLRAPTPSAAAELAVFELRAYYERVAQAQSRLELLLHREEEKFRLRLKAYAQRVQRFHPLNRLQTDRLRLRQQRVRMDSLMDGALSRSELRLDQDGERLRLAMQEKLSRAVHRLEVDAAKLEAYSPLKRLSGGYAFAEDDRGKALLSVRQTEIGKAVTLHLRDGVLKTEVKEIVHE